MTDEKQTEAGAGRSRNGSRKRYVRIVFLIVAALLTAAAGCSRKPPEETVKPTAVPASKVPPELTETPEATLTPEVTSTPETNPTPEATLTPEDTPATEPAKVPSDTGTAFTPSDIGGRVTFTGMTVDVSAARVGDTVRFGSYEQDNNVDNGKEDIEWYVLDKQDGKLLLLSRYALDCKRYHEEYEDVTWETCTLRDWLNGTFFTTAFGTAEQGRIVTTRVKNEDNPEWGTGGGNDTEDKVFLLSTGEAERYFSSGYSVKDPARRVKLTAYAEAQGGLAYSEAEYGAYHTTEYDGNGWWWLRSSGSNHNCSAADVGSRGYVSRGGSNVDTKDNVVRPALWLSLEETGSGGRVTFTGMTVDVSAAQVGDTVRFGSYEQDNDAGNGAEAIEWLVLDKQDGKLLLLSKYALDCKRYHEEHEEVTWEMCTLRDWLNNTFFTTAFCEAEQERIVTTRVKNKDNTKWGTGGENDTEDRIFLLSTGEVLGYFDPDPGASTSARRVKLTAYAEAQGGRSYRDAEQDSYGTPEYDGNGWWWLRSPGTSGLCAAGVGETGEVWRGSNYICCDNHVVRPALWLNQEE